MSGENKNNQPKAQGEQVQQRKQSRWRKGQHSVEPKKKDAEAIPILKYGPSNNFAKFKEAMSKAALKQYGDLGRLIRQGTYYIPPEPNRATYGPFDATNDPDGLKKATYLEAMKHHQKKLANMEDDRAKLFAMIMMYLSEESLDAVKKEPTWTKIEDEADAEGLWKLVEQKHKVHTASEVKEITKLTARANYQMIRQGGYESIIAYKERFNFALKSYEDQGNKKLDPPDIAMDFFRGLDNARYSTFKTDYINGLTSKAIDPPKDLNEIYLLANQWLKPKAAGSGYASTFATTLDHPEDRRPNADRRGRNKRSGKQQQQQQHQQEPAATDSNKQDNKQKRPIKCFICEGPHFANKCPERKQSANQEESGDEDERHAHMTWGEAAMFTTYLEKQVNAIGYSGFRETEVLLDNQADISIMKPGLLRAFKPAEKTVRVNGVGGLQLTVDRKGYLDDFFDVYTSEHTKANVLSFSEVEDTYDITYIPRQAFVVHLPERDIVFKRRGKLYIADFAREGQVHVTKAYTKAEEERA
jgi:hypothetical protein